MSNTIYEVECKALDWEPCDAMSKGFKAKTPFGCCFVVYQIRDGADAGKWKMVPPRETLAPLISENPQDCFNQAQRFFNLLVARCIKAVSA